MKRIFIFSALLFIIQIMAQVEVTSPTGGVYKITYGRLGDFSYYNTSAAQGPIYVHTWINPSDNTVGDYFSDSWRASTVVLTWDAGQNAYVGEIDLTTKMFTDTGNNVPTGTTVTAIHFMFKDATGVPTKSSNIYDANVSTTLSGTLASVDYKTYQGKTTVINGSLYTSLRGDLSLNVYDYSGRLIKSMNAKSTGSPIALNLTKKGNYILRISAGATREVVKFMY